MLMICTECKNNVSEYSEKCQYCGCPIEIIKRHYNGSCGYNAEDFSVENGVIKGYKGEDDNVVIPKFITEIAPYAFSGKENIKSVNICDGVKRIGSNAFQSCINLTLML